MFEKLDYKKFWAIIGIAIIAIVILTTSWDKRKPPAYVPIISATATLNFPSTLPATSSDLTMTITGAAVGDVVVLGVPNGSMPANGGFTAWISSANTGTIRYFNMDALSTFDPASGVFKLCIIKN